ncbi:RNA polymerase sigma-32 factor [Parvibaculum indicum]|uniref:RNA polymerase factor sigma-32 n=1 Tax=Parvibaculum indicum TaxID=562969 RepID=UPI00142394B7|nr:RNA polymerase factor sigma-32 [Parvibaculum indicum]NIJ42334.1 RNA polymerase sigma-32 factor [Parvibaculum indicum]
MTHQETGDSQSANRRFTKHAMSVPLLEPDREFELARRWKDDRDEKALHELTGAYMRLVISLATKFRNYGLPHADLVQEGNVGLMQAAARFEPERGVRFSTYARWWIRAAIQDYVLRNWSIVRTGTTAAHKSLFFNLRRLRAMIDNGARENLSEDERIFIAEKLGVGVEDVEVMQARLYAGDRSLNAPMREADAEDGSLEWQDILACERALPEETVMETRDSRRRSEWIEEAMEALSERERLIVRERRLREDTATLETLGHRLGLSKERVRQIEHRAIDKMREALLANLPSAGVADRTDFTG